MDDSDITLQQYRVFASGSTSMRRIKEPGKQPDSAPLAVWSVSFPANLPVYSRRSMVDATVIDTITEYIGCGATQVHVLHPADSR